MTGFMEKIIKLALDRIPADQLSDALFLFPSKRAVVFFNQALKNTVNRPDPFLLPAAETLSSWIIRIGGWHGATADTLLITLYHCYQQLESQHTLTFEQFYPLSRTILADLMELDKACLTDDEIRNIARNTLSSTRSDSQFNRILSMLPSLHEQFNQALLGKRTVHYPLALNTLIRSKEQIQKALERYSGIFLGGFYPIDQGEIKLFSMLMNEANVFTVWDNDRYFIENAGLEAALLFKNPVLFPQGPQAMDDDLRHRSRAITLIETQGSIAQAKAVGSILEEINTHEKSSEIESALILPHEPMLLPLLSAIPKELDQINITMGYPLSISLMVSLFSNLEQLQNQLHPSVESVDFKALHKLLTHPEWSPLIDEDRKQKLNLALSKRVRTLSRNDAMTMMGDLSSLLTPPDSAQSLCGQLLLLLEKLKDSILHEESPHKLELLNQIRRQVLSLERMSQNDQLNLTVRTAWQILHERLEESSLPFSGEPLLGVQIMGMLETRCLDFKNLIFLSFNEGIYPRGKSDFSLIPADLKRQYKMASYREYDALLAYNFYRLLKRSQRVWLMYDGSGRGDQGAEASRFIRQIEHELLRYSPGSRLQRQSIIQSPPPISPCADITVKNNERLRQRWLKLEFSATAINTHNSCPLRFFYRYGLKMKEPARQSDAMDPLGIGQITHTCLEQLFSPFIGQTIDQKIMESMQSRVHTLVTQTSREYFPGLDVQRGRPYLESTILTELLTQVLTAQTSAKPYVLIGVENQFLGKIRLDDGTSYQIIGKFDRIDLTEEGWRIVDYKSGRMESGSLKLDDMPERYQIDSPFNKKNMAWQLLLYQWLFCQAKHISPSEVSCAVLPLRSPDEGFCHLQTTMEARELQSLFSTVLQGFFRRLSDPNTLFRQTDNTETCAFCPYRGVCHR